MKRKHRFGRQALRPGMWYGVLSVLVFLLMYSCGNNAGKAPQADTAKQVYYCPMHPDVQQDHPGTCPKPECHGMPLVLKKNNEALDAVLRPTSSSVLSKVNLANPVYQSLPSYVAALGYLDYDNYGKFDISSRYSGRIEKLYVKYNYQPVKKGDILFEIYSPDLVTAQENLLYALKTSPNDTALINAARQKLVLLQLTNDQIREIETSGKAKTSLPVYSKYDGHIHEMLDAGMTSGAMSSVQQSSLISVKEGMYVERGKVLFNVANPHQVVAVLQIKSVDIGKVQLNQRVTFYLNNDTSMSMARKVDFIEPVFRTSSKTLTIRVNVNNDQHNHKVGSLVNAKIYSDSLETLWVPATAVVDLGMSKMVWVWKNGYFKATKVETGTRSGNMVEIADGITESDQVAGEAHYLSDSEDFIKISDDE